MAGSAPGCAERVPIRVGSASNPSPESPSCYGRVTGLGQHLADWRGTSHTEGLGTDFKLGYAPAFIVASVVTRLGCLSTLRAVQAARLLQAAGPTTGDVHGPLLHPTRL